LDQVNLARNQSKAIDVAQNDNEATACSLQLSDSESGARSWLFEVNRHPSKPAVADPGAIVGNYGRKKCSL